MRNIVKITKSIILLAIISAFTMPVLGDNSQWYGGIGIGISRLKPDPNGTAFNVSDSSSNGLKLFAGFDWKNNISFEAYISDLGEAKLTPNGYVEYIDFGVSGLYYLYNSENDKAQHRHSGFSIYGKAGLGFMKNKSDVNYDRVNNAHLLWGAGLEYGLPKNLFLRAEAEFYDKDSQFISISLIKHFGKSRRQLPIQQPVQTVKVVETVKDSDRDGVFDDADICPASLQGASVDSKGCEIPEVMVLKDIKFKTSSARLKEFSMKILDDVAATLLRYPQMVIEVAGYTDNRGSISYNKKLSQKRAESVVNYLSSNGVTKSNMMPKGFGPENPIADNGTSEGRSTNRRVELHILKR